MFNEDLKVGRLSIALYPTYLTAQDGKRAYYAKVVNREKMSMMDVCKDIVASGNNCGLSEQELENVWHVICQARMRRLAEGISSEDDIGTLYPTVKGVFTDDRMPFTKGVHTVSFGLRPSAAASQTMEALTPVITQGNTCHPVIESVQDLKTKSGTVLTPGGLLTVKGRSICLVGDDEAVGLYFENVLDEADVVRVSPEDMGVNSTSTLCLSVPSELKDGCQYRLRLVTQFNGSKKVFRKEPQTAYAADELQTTAARTA